MKKYDVLAIGELLVDFVPGGVSAFGAWPNLQAMPGGAPANFIATCAKYGMQTGFIGAVGDDSFGGLLIQTLQKAGVDTEGITKTEETFTTLAFVMLDETGDRDFTFARKPGADTRLELTETHREMIRNSRCLHFGTLSLTDEPSRTATKEAVRIAKESGVWISFDPNYRAPLWKDENSAKEAMLWGVSQCNSVKIGKDELQFMYGSSYDESLALLFREKEIALALITDGIRGTDYLTRNIRGHVDAFPMPDTVDTTGAGDIFGGAFLSQLLQKAEDPHLPVSQISEQELRAIVLFANAAATLSTTAYGGISAIPEKEAVEKIIRGKKS